MELSLIDYALLALTGAWAAAVNSVAGGGTFFTFPVLMFVGLPPVLANSTNKFGIWLGSFASIRGYWHEIKEYKSQLLVLTILAALGGVGGSLLLLVTPQETFSTLVPWLMLTATLLLATGRRLIDWIEQRMPAHPTTSLLGKVASWVGQTIIAIYAGFFGAGIGILLIALYELMGIRSIHHMNGLKVVTATAAHSVSVITFIIAGAIIWPAAIALAAGALIGGYCGAILTKRLPTIWVRRFIIVYGLAVSCWYFIT